ncbi:MAG: processing protein [Chloroflexota bacterium]|nr:processing protein [Chloroflexota bacterium]
MVADDKKYWLAFSRVKGIGAARTQLLVKYFGSLKAAWEASEPQLRKAGLSPKPVQALLELRRNYDPQSEYQRVIDAGIQVLTMQEAEYPKRLAAIEYPPPVLFVKGKLCPEDDFSVAIVGTRRVTAYGRQVANELAAYLVQNQITVVSGLARGVDGIAHQAALNAGGRTLAVLGSGVDVIYPPEHRNLAAAIQQNGALISDYYPGTAPEGNNFPPRNRIISGLSLAVVIIEAGERSGALITANFAAGQGREVFAVPGTIYAPRSKGTNRLIRDGALPLLDFSEILEALKLTQIDDYRYAKQVLPENDIELLLMEALRDEPMHINEIKAATGLPIDKISSTLVLMELKGLVRNTGNLTYLSIGEAELRYEEE